jgi:hypothetical protein
MRRICSRWICRRGRSPVRDYLAGVSFSLTASASACTIRGLGLFPGLLRLEKNAQRLEFKCVQSVEESLEWASPEAAHR